MKALDDEAPDAVKTCMSGDRRIARMVGCSRLAKGILAAVAVMVIVWIAVKLECSSRPGHGHGPELATRNILNALRIGISGYQLEYGRLPINKQQPEGGDGKSRSRGVGLTTLMGNEETVLNPKQLSFVEMRIATNFKYGLWQDGDEWVLSDWWGEPYYLVFDTDENDEIENPEFGADQSDPVYAKRCQTQPPPPTLPGPVIIYSSGPDRDPKSWHDNITSWR